MSHVLVHLSSLVPRLTLQLWCRLHFHNASYLGVCLQCSVEFES